MAPALNTGVDVRELLPSDARALLRLRLDNRGDFSRYGPEHPDSFFTPLQQARVIEAALVRDDEVFLGIFDPSARVEGGLVGYVRLSVIVRGLWQNANLGYGVDCELRGRGYASLAVGAAVDYAFAELGLHRVQAAVMPENAASARVLVKNGFRLEGRSERYLYLQGAWRDHDIYARTSDEPDTPA